MFAAGCVELGGDPPEAGDPAGADADALALDGEVIYEPPTPGVLGFAPDPSAASESGWCYANYSWAGTHARVYWPANGSCASTVYSPMVVMLPGKGFAHTDYHYLMRHLAKNNYIGVAIDAIPAGIDEDDYQDTADKAWAFVNDFMWSSWSKRFFIDNNNVALIGHSRGGEVARFIADDLAGDPTFHVRSVIGLAPTDHHDRRLDGGNTQSALFLVGSMDQDTLPLATFGQHDHTSSEASQFDPGLNPNAIWRSMKLLEGAAHTGFAEDALLGVTALADMTQGYALAYLDAHLKNDLTYYEDYIRGDLEPAAATYASTTQYSDGLARRVIDNFQDGTIAGSTIGGGVTVGFGAGGVINLGTSAATHHDTFALRYTPPANGAGFSWAIPAGKRNLNPYEHLSLRVGQSAGPVTDDLRIRIVNSGVTSAWVRPTDHGALAQPMTMCQAPVLPAGTACVNTAVQAHLGTIRIPLGAFGAHDNVTAIELGATSEATDGEFFIDSLEASEIAGAP